MAPRSLDSLAPSLSDFGILEFQSHLTNTDQREPTSSRWKSSKKVKPDIFRYFLLKIQQKLRNSRVQLWETIVQRNKTRITLSVVFESSREKKDCNEKKISFKKVSSKILNIGIFCSTTYSIRSGVHKTSTPSYLNVILSPDLIDLFPFLKTFESEEKTAR